MVAYLRGIKNNMFSLEFARVWHNVFASQLIYLIDGIEQGLCIDPQIAGDHARCRLGGWMASVPEDIRRLPEFADLIDKHAHFHGLAGELVALHGAGEHERARALCDGEFAAASQAVAGALDVLSERLSGLGLNLSPFQCAAPAERPSVWNDSLLIGIPVIDRQHKEIAGIVDQMLTNRKLEINEEKAVDLLTELSAILGKHFDTEEHMMRRLPIPQEVFEAHCREHTRVLGDLVDLNLAVAAGQHQPIEQYAERLERWFIEEVVLHDLDIGRALAAVR